MTMMMVKMTLIIIIIIIINTETNDISTMNSNNRIAATLYSLGT